MKVIGIIPCRLASTRLPRKALADIGGKPMIQHVWERACRSELDEVIVATDSREIYEAAQRFGARAEMTSAEHVSGTGRIEELSGKLEADLYVNIQGDEPLISPDVINQIIASWRQAPERHMYTVASAMPASESLDNRNVVKVVTDESGDALYFSRAPLGSARKHIGIYAYTAEALRLYASHAPGPLELAENLEQLRFLEHGLKIRVIETEYESIGVDTEEDLDRVRALVASERPAIKLIAMDVDGTLTDGQIILDSNGVETKHFHVKDGMGIKLAHDAGLLTAIITGRQSEVVSHRARELGVPYVRQGVSDKVDALQAILAECGVRPEETAYVGDDINDLEICRFVGLSFAVRDAAPRLQEAVDRVLSLDGGRGAVREAVEAILLGNSGR